MIQVVSGSSSGTIVAGVSYTSLLAGLLQASAVENVGEVIPIACTLRNSFIVLSAAPGIGNSRRFTLRVNYTDTAFVITIADDQTFGAFTTPDLSLSVGDFVTLKCESFGSPGGGFSRYGYEVETASSTQAVFFGRGGPLNSYAVRYFGVLSQISASERDIDGGPGDCTNVVPIDGTITGYRIRVRENLSGTQYLSGRFTIYKSTDTGATFVAQNGSGGTPDTRLTLTNVLTTTQAVASFSLPVSRGDLLYLRWDTVSAPGQWGIAISTLFTSSEADQWPYCGQGAPVTGTIDIYNAIFSNSFGWAGESGRQQSYGGYTDFSLARMIVYMDTPPGAGDSRAFITRLNGADQTLAVTLSDADQIAEDVIHTVPIIFLDEFGLKMDATGSPGTSKTSWGFVQGTSSGGGGGGIPGDVPVLGEIGPYMVHHWPREIP